MERNIEFLNPRKAGKEMNQYRRKPRDSMTLVYERIQELKDELKGNPNSIDLLNQLVKIYNITGQHKKAIEAGNKIIESGGKNQDTFNNLFYAYDMLEDFDNVLKVLKKYLSSFRLSKKPELLKFSYSPYAKRYFKERKKIELLADANKLPFNLFSEAIEYNFNTSFRFSKIGWSERSCEALSLILEHYPEDIDIINALIKNYLSREQNTKAKEWLDRALSINKRNLMSRLLLGDYYRKTGKNKESENEYKYLISASFSLDEFNRIQVPDTGGVELDTIILITVLVRVGILYNETGEYRHAITHLSKILDYSKRIRTLSSGKDPSLTPIYHNLGIAYQGLGSNKLALKAFKTALKHDSGNGDVSASLGELYYLMKKYKLAIKTLQHVVRFKPESYYSWHMLAKSHHERGENAYAIGTNEKCLGIDPKFGPALKLQEELSRYQKDKK